jgi:hypothetical protein
LNQESRIRNPDSGIQIQESRFRDSRFRDSRFRDSRFKDSRFRDSPDSRIPGFQD